MAHWLGSDELVASSSRVKSWTREPCMVAEAAALLGGSAP